MKVFGFLRRKSRVEFPLPTPFELLTNSALMLHGLTLREPFSSNDDYKYFLRQAVKNINAILAMYKCDSESE